MKLASFEFETSAADLQWSSTREFAKRWLEVGLAVIRGQMSGKELKGAHRIFVKVEVLDGQIECQPGQN